MKTPYRFKIGAVVYVNTSAGIRKAVVLKRSRVYPPDQGKAIRYVYCIEFEEDRWTRIPEVQLMTWEEAVAERLME